MFKRNLNNKDDSPAKRARYDQNNTRRRQSDVANISQNFDDLWGDDFGEEEIEEMDFIASQATQEEAVFVAPKPITPARSSRHSFDSMPSTSSGYRGKNASANNLQSQMLASSDINKEIFESTQAIRFDEFENNVKGNSLNSTFRARQEVTGSNVVLVSDDEQVEKWKEEKKKLLEDFLTKEGETEFLRQQLNQIQARAENSKKEQARLMEAEIQKFRSEIVALHKEKSTLESQLQYQNLQLNQLSEKCKQLESGSVKFTQPQVNMVKPNNKDRSNTSIGWSKKIKTKETSVQVEQTFSVELLRSSLIVYPLKTIPQYAFEPSETEKSVVEIKIEEKIGKRNLAIIQEEETFRIFENPELSKPKVTIVNGKNLTTEFIMPDLALLVNKTSEEINSDQVISFINKLVATTRELLLNSTLALQKISQAMQNDDIRDMNELYLSEFYEMPVPHTKSVFEARPWYDLERGIETRRAIGILAHMALASDYLANYVAGNVKLKTSKDPYYEEYAKQMLSYDSWYKKGFDFEFLDLIFEFVSVVGTIRRSHQFAGLINALLLLIVNVQNNVGFSTPAVKRVCSIFKEIVYSRPLLACFPLISNILKEFSQYSIFVSKLCIAPDKSGISSWKGSLSFTPDACALEILIAQLEHFKLDPITLIKVTRDLALFSNIALLNNSIPWIEKTNESCGCCLNLLKFVVINLCECTKINVENIKNKYTKTNISWRISKHELEKKNNKITWKEKLSEDWQCFEQNCKENFWGALKTSQYSAIAHGIRLLSYLAKRDLDFMIRLLYIEDAFHLFLNNLAKRNDLKLKQSDEIALKIVKNAFDLEKNKEEAKSSQQLNVVSLEVERWTDFTPANSDLIKLYEEYF